MLLQRVITAVVLLALLLPTLWVSTPWPFALLTLLLIATAGWEWSKLNGVATIAAVGPGVLLALAGLWAVHTGGVAKVPAAVWWGATVAWLALGALALRGGPSAWLRWPAVLRLALGLLALWVAWLALAKARMVGVNFLLSALCLVWVADIGAYAAGRACGRRKLAPTISPGKSWEGVAGGMLSVLVLAALWVLWIDRRWPVDSASLYTQFVERLGWAGLLLLALLLAGFSVVGDLFESLVKRAAGTKDSSRLLPGHGGVLDRIDALLPVLPIAMALASL
ncbi:MAG: phosphatidate cytidylyltransferase [Burkholderiaceae bacterium]|nr:phosphatidate cytidylyltransferase [Burkholderiaceae bacterium]